MSMMSRCSPQTASRRYRRITDKDVWAISGMPCVCGLSADIPNQQPAIREQGFGTRFKDTPPEFMNKKEDNKIERINKPTKKKRRTKKKSK